MSFLTLGLGGSALATLGFAESTAHNLARLCLTVKSAQATPTITSSAAAVSTQAARATLAFRTLDCE